MNHFFLLCLAILLLLSVGLLLLVLRRGQHTVIHIHPRAPMSPTEIEKDGIGETAKSGKQNSEKAGEIPMTSRCTVCTPSLSAWAGPISRMGSHFHH